MMKGFLLCVYDAMFSEAECDEREIIMLIGDPFYFKCVSMAHLVVYAVTPGISMMPVPLADNFTFQTYVKTSICVSQSQTCCL